MKSKADAPQIGVSVRGSKSGKPIMVALDLLGRRNTLRILWELHEAQPLTFRALLEAAETNPSLLNTRLRELRETGLVAHLGEGYELTAQGLALLVALQPLVQWAKDWGEGTAIQPEDNATSTATE